MQIIPRKNPFTLIALLGMLLALSSLACSIGGLSLGQDAAVLDITLSQNQVDQAFQKANANQNQTQSKDVLLDRITGVELHDGFVRVLGTARKPDGSSGNGSYDMSLSAQNDQLNAKITAVAIPGVELNDPRIVSANQKMAEELTRAVTETNGDVQFKEAVVKEGGLS